MTQIFKVGDRAIVISDDGSSGGQRLSKRGEVVIIDGSYGIYVKFDDDSLNMDQRGCRCWYYHASNLINEKIVNDFISPSVKSDMVRTLTELTEEQKDSDLSPEERALIELGVINDKLVLTDTDYVIRQYYKANKAAIGKQAIEDVKKLKGEIKKASK